MADLLGIEVVAPHQASLPLAPAADTPICVTCGTQYPPAPEPPAQCPICLDERQYVGHAGQRWTTPADLAASHANRLIELEPGLLEILTEPQFGIGQRALAVEGLLWDCVSLLDEPTAARIEAAGGVEAIAISHPHYYTTMVDWAERLDAEVLLHAADREHVMRRSSRVRLWDGEHLELANGCELHRLGGHFAGATVCRWPAGAEGRGALLSGDVIQVVADRDWVSFMWSYPNMIPLPADEIARIRARVEPLGFDRVHGAFDGASVWHGAHAKVLRSADRYLDALERGRG